MKKYGKILRYISRPGYLSIPEARDLVRRYVAQDIKNERQFSVSYSGGVASVSVYAISLATYKSVLIETASLSEGMTVPALTILNPYYYVVNTSIKDVRPNNNMIFNYYSYYSTPAAVSEWTDMGRNGIDAKQSVGASQPTGTTNYVTFDGVNDYLVIDDPKKLMVIETDENFAFYCDFYLDTSLADNYKTLLATCNNGSGDSGIVIQVKTDSVKVIVKGADATETFTVAATFVTLTRQTLYITFDRLKTRLVVRVGDVVIATETITQSIGKILNEYQSTIGYYPTAGDYFKGSIYNMFFEKIKNI
ncbi:hypothetical protein KKH23_06455 [Patescibacteria group bacterium]|uniref:Lectin/glucanase superfamily protein n=1 Tax=viral metagenome TaxID=1070528 RepID=A0A6M3MEZ1_9ZZZZ|nr:hypothetical protein [Patescibacteria group bacterium]